MVVRVRGGVVERYVVYKLVSRRGRIGNVSRRVTAVEVGGSIDVVRAVRCRDEVVDVAIAERVVATRV